MKAAAPPASPDPKAGSQGGGVDPSMHTALAKQVGLLPPLQQCRCCLCCYPCSTAPCCITCVSSVHVCAWSGAPNGCIAHGLSWWLLQVESMSGLVGQLAGDVRGAMGRLDGLSSQVSPGMARKTDPHQHNTAMQHTGCT